MIKTTGIIKKTLKDSIAEKSGLKSNDIILKINNRPVFDILDYLHLTYKENITLTVKRKNDLLKFTIKKSAPEPLGLEFNKDIFDKIHLCENKCIFCFVDQLPRGLRPSLYMKDDDFRLSLLGGNFITLTNLSLRDWHKIKRLHISPLYISVHATESKIRSFMLGNKKAGKILKQIQKLAKMNITMHIQIVIIPGINDGGLEKSITQLAKLYPKITSIGIVPVGITKYYKGNILTLADKNLAYDICQKVKKYQYKYLKKYNNPLVYAADEFYIKAGLSVPLKKYYGDFCQIENGIGLVRSFLDDFQDAKKNLPKKIKPAKRFSLISGEMFYPFLRKTVNSLNKLSGLKIIALKIKNNFLGSQINVTGLLSGQDIYNGLKNKNLLDYLIVPQVCLKDNNLFIDNLSIKDLEKKLEIKIITLPAEAKALINHIKEIKF